MLAGSAQDIGCRSSQQDAFELCHPADAAFVSHGGVLAVLADGMGGLAHGGLASTVAVRTFVASYATKLPDETVAEALLRSFYVANDAVLALIRESGGMAGTTLAAAAVHQGVLFWVASGDSRIYHCRGSAAWQITRDHVYWRDLEEQVAAGRIDTSEAACDVQRHSLTSHLGRINPTVERPQKPLPLQPGDIVLICSDGLHGVLSDGEIGAEVGRGAPQYVCEALVRRALARARPDQDNVTVLALGLPPARRRLFWS